MFTVDKFLGGKLLLKQAKPGLRATSDAVLLSAFVHVKKHETLLDVGAGNGVIGLCVVTRTPCELYSLEIQPELAGLIQVNADLNCKKVHIVQQDIFAKKDLLKGKLFDHVVTNPPFYDCTGKGRQNEQQKKAYRAEFDLKKWLEYCLKHLKSNGTFCIINRSEILGDILKYVSDKLGKIEIYPIQTKDNQPAKRIVIRGVLGGKTPLKVMPPIIMHHSDGSCSPIAEKILREGKEI